MLMKLIFPIEPHFSAPPRTPRTPSTSESWTWLDAFAPLHWVRVSVGMRLPVVNRLSGVWCVCCRGTVGGSCQDNNQATSGCTKMWHVNSDWTHQVHLFHVGLRRWHIRSHYFLWRTLWNSWLVYRKDKRSSSTSFICSAFPQREITPPPLRDVTKGTYPSWALAPQGIISSRKLQASVLARVCFQIPDWRKRKMSNFGPFNVGQASLIWCLCCLCQCRWCRSVVSLSCWQ